MSGRPRKKRIRSKGEGGSSTRVSKLGSQGSCSNCKKRGYNKASCKEPILKKSPKPKGVPGMDLNGEVMVGLNKVVQVQVGLNKIVYVGLNRVVHVGLKGKLYQVMERKEDRTQDDPVQTQDDPLQTQDQDQDIDLTNTQVEQTQEQTKDQVPTQEQPEQVTPRRPSARILQRKLAKQLEPF
ncbi:hypothetical protein Tco_0614514 [Tanacetum coccineum]